VVDQQAAAIIPVEKAFAFVILETKVATFLEGAWNTFICATHIECHVSEDAVAHAISILPCVL